MDLRSDIGGLFLMASLLAASGHLTADEPAVMWTAGDKPQFRYLFLENVKTTTLLHATPETGTFNHHPYLACYQGVLFACWDSQARDENTSGQHGMFCYSTDGGKTWSDPRRLFPPLAENVPASEMKEPRPFQTSQGFVDIDGQLYAVEIVDKSLKEKVYRFNEVSRDRIGWLARAVRADGALGEIFWLSETTPDPEPDFPAYPAGEPSLVARINAHFKEPANLPKLVFGPRAHPDSDDEHRMTEPTPTWQLESGTWVRLYRDAGSVHANTKREVEASKSRRNYAAFSFDDGKTWTTPTRTDFPDSCARSNAGRLPNGQYFVINNLLPMSPKKGGRSLLAVSLSRDGLQFDRSVVLRFVAPGLRYEGKAKSIGYQYPHSLVVGKHLWVIYSVNKEDIEVARIPLSEFYSLE
ncbi:MAG: exo-alpha-sialidase [Planctomycetes bacterium]|nr:exo-alpha-sialidase [Planctomycetota bacterium]